MGTNKQHDERIDRTVAERAQTPPQRPVNPWKPPWPPIRIGVAEWVLMRESRTEPAAIVRAVTMGNRGERFFRVVTWAPTSEDRQLVGYYPSLSEADQAVLFDPPNPITPDVKLANGH